jgi:hypothetical protein
MERNALGSLLSVKLEHLVNLFTQQVGCLGGYAVSSCWSPACVPGGTPHRPVSGPNVKKASAKTLLLLLVIIVGSMKVTNGATLLE